MLNLLIWLLNPFLGDDKKPSIKRFLALFFAYEIHNVVSHKPYDSNTMFVLIVLGVNMGVMIGISTYQTLTYFTNKNNKDEDINDLQNGK